MKTNNKIRICLNYFLSANDTDEKDRYYSLWTQESDGVEFEFVKFFEDISSIIEYIQNEVIHKKLLDGELKNEGDLISLIKIMKKLF